MDNVYYTVGENVKMRFNKGTVELYSNNGTLWPDWLERAGVYRYEIKSIHVAEGTVYLPEWSGGIYKEEALYAGFGGLSNMKSIDLSRFDTSRVKDMSWMFYDCQNLEHLDLSSFDTQNVTNMKFMFYNCNALQDINTHGLNTANVTNIPNVLYKSQGKTFTVGVASKKAYHEEKTEKTGFETEQDPLGKTVTGNSGGYYKNGAIRLIYIIDNDNTK